MQNNIKSDEQAQTNSLLQALNWVGISQVQSSLKMNDFDIPVLVDLIVDLKSGNRGIHMSRLYALMMEHLMGQKITYDRLDTLCSKSISSQEGLSMSSKLLLKFDLPISTIALKSKTKGFRHYPIQIKLKKKSMDTPAVLTLEMKITYSSTCPQSAQLSKEYFKNTIKSHDQLIEWFDSEQIYLATPHAQRSEARVQLQFDQNTDLNIEKWISGIESTLGTAVQTSVKKADEMEFARLNAENTMFCEDAVRKMATYLDQFKDLSGYRLTVQHLESLHPHNAFSQMSRHFYM